MKLILPKRAPVKWIIYAVVLLVLYSLQTAPGFLTIKTYEPNLVIPFAVCVALFENEVAAGVFGCIAGMLCDMDYHKLFGFNAIIVMCLCVVISFLVLYLMRTKLINAIFFVGALMLVDALLDYLFFYLIWSYENSYIILLRYILPAIPYTMVITIPIYFLIKAVATKFNETLRA